MSTVERIKGQIENIPALANTTDGWKALGGHHVWVLTVRLAPGFGRVLLNGFQQLLLYLKSMCIDVCISFFIFLQTS